MFRSVRFQTWVYFFLLTMMILFVLWALQLLFFRSAYRSMKKQDMEKLSESIIKKYPGEADNRGYEDWLQSTAMHNGLSVVIFRTQDEFKDCPVGDVAFHAEYVAGMADKSVLASPDNPQIIHNWENFYPALRERGEISSSYRSKECNYLVYGAELEEGTFLYVSTPAEVFDSTVSIMTDQLIFVTLLCLLMSIVVSYFISNRITKPIAEFSDTAKKLGQGDYSVRFKGNGYTEIETLADTLNYATTEIGKTEQMRRDFLANVSHDLRTPLTMVKAYAEMIRDISGSDEVKRHKHSQVIIDEADRLTSLVGDILNLSKIQSGAEKPMRERVDLSALIKTVTERFDVYATRDGYVFAFESEGDCTALCDAGHLEQVVYNLMGNALSYTGENKTVRTCVRRIGDKVRVSVRDYGEGIAPEDLDKVWERYYRANQQKRTVVGSGLGLSIVKSILDLHGAQFGVSSQRGEGTEFWFELEAADRTDEERAAESHSKKKTPHK